MKTQRLLAGLAALALLTPTLAGAQTRTAQSRAADGMFAHALMDVEKAFYRKQSFVNPSTGLRDPAPGALADLTGYCFMPANANFAITLMALDTARSSVCIEMRVKSEALARAAARALAMPGVSRADAQCQAVSASPVPTTWPASVYAVKVLDSEDALAPTLLPSAPVFSGVSSQAYARPAITLPAAPGQWSQAGTFIVSNPAMPALEGQPPAPVMSIIKASVRPGFTVEHNCVQVAAQQSCTVAVRYQGTQSELYRVGKLRLDFSDGHFAIVSLLGQRGAGAPTTLLTGALAPATGTPATGGTTTTQPSPQPGTTPTTSSDSGTSTPAGNTSVTAPPSNGCLNSGNAAACAGGKGRLRRGG